ncbi:MAG: hypothetical protein ACK476_13185 [Fluviicola sp.]|jgi:hypothetical protein
MGLTLYFNYYKNQQPAKVPTYKIIELFEEYIKWENEDGVMVEYDEMNSTFILIDMIEEFSEGFAINKPYGDRRLYESIYAASKFAPCILISPVGNSTIFNKNDINHFVLDLQECIHSDDFPIEFFESEEDFLNTHV